MGSKRPELLIRIEHVLWKMMLKSSKSGSEGMVELLKTAYEEIDGLLGEDVEVTDVDWFDNGKQLHPSFRYQFLNRKPAHEDAHEKAHEEAHDEDSSPTLADFLNGLARIEDRTNQGHKNNSEPSPGKIKIRPLKRPRSPGSSPAAIDLIPVHQIYVGGTMYELIDLSSDEV